MSSERRVLKIVTTPLENNELPLVNKHIRVLDPEGNEITVTALEILPMDWQTGFVEAKITAYVELDMEVVEAE